MLPADPNAPLETASNPNSESVAAPKSTPPAVMARILEPRVRSNAKNNPKNAETLPISISVTNAPEASALQVNTPVAESPMSAAPEPSPVMTPQENALWKSPVESGDREENQEMAATLSEVRDLLLEMHENGHMRDRAFDLLYEELSGYKNDFYLERLKPTLRALLFLLDSIEEFEREIEAYAARDVEPTGEIVKANLVHFREQLTDVLTISDLTPITPANDKFDPKNQRAVEVVKVEAAHNNTVQRQVRGGWKLGGKMLRPADVVVGRSS